MPSSQRFHTLSAAETYQLGQRLGRLLTPASVIALHGDLGAGKTTFTQGIAAGLDIRQRLTSPTFTLINEYSTPRGWRLIHIDSYRLVTTAAPVGGVAQEADMLGLDDFLAADDAIVIIEWAERLADYLPADRLEISMTHCENESERTITIRASGAQSQETLERLAGEPITHD